ncbi:3-hydroxyacyl-CoA dehydrogenase NAD-binding domain-containing protein [Streptomyces sp. NPDC058066]
MDATLKVAVIGGGHMGGGIAWTFAAHGFPTCVDMRRTLARPG